ncbi:type II secretion system protein GspC [Thalassotalea sp. LPB0316]|uniref:type II secretion system protein GspC n=1 Tax=Thalassotalea sp. LPB0316 TaxID=2769490 RepID=UPI001865C4E6|nr:type II secretion system protein GspC [Thalassotalea sp. LPB0316]QOL26587.1 type II secretion system protein GspC [Thalassotalea sp. LPB0316]
MSLQQTIKPLLSAFEKVPQKTLANVISGALLVYIAFVFAKMTWQLVPNDTTTNQLPVAKSYSTAQSSDAAVDVGSIKALNLFGQFNRQDEKPKVVEVQDAPQTRLNLTLTGVVASSDERYASAIIESGGSQYTYGIGDKIEKTRATLEQVYSDRVLIKQSGTLETLMLDGVKYNKTPASATRPSAPVRKPSRQAGQVIDQRENQALAEQATVLKQDLTKDPAKIVDYLTIAPQRQGGQLLGYRLNPGKNPEFFKSSGLRPGDIAVQMNGLDLTSPQEASDALKALRTESEITLLVDRGGELTEILFSIN